MQLAEVLHCPQLQFAAFAESAMFSCTETLCWHRDASPCSCMHVLASRGRHSASASQAHGCACRIESTSMCSRTRHLGTWLWLWMRPPLGRSSAPGRCTTSPGQETVCMRCMCCQRCPALTTSKHTPKHCWALRRRAPQTPTCNSCSTGSTPNWASACMH